ncbi:MAG: hypothetical protein Q8N77_06455 [Nanoarchaeota archaeon]|nr:hypothetical protein [Nanoarchaeota archaeon]
MMKKKAKLEMETLGKILLLTAFLIIFLLMFKGCKDQMTNVGRVGLNEYVCWFSHALKADLTFLFPSGCQTIDVEKTQTETDIARLMRTCWWMHGQGDKDITTGETLAGILAQRSIWWYDIARTCYVFTPDKDVPVTDLENYLRRRDKSGKEIEKDSKATAWYYIQKKDREEIGICMDRREEKLQKGKKYFIIFYDDRSPISQGVRDRILISRDPNFGEKETGFIIWSTKLFEKGIKTLEQFLGMKINPWNNKCYLWEDIIRKTETALEEKKLEEQATEIFNEVSDKFRECYETEPKENCMCDDSEMSLESLPQGYEIKVERESANEYNLALYNEKNEWVIGESFSTKIGAINKAESDLKKGVNLPDTNILCSEGLGLEESFSLPRTASSLVYNLDSRYYLQPFSQDITPCASISQRYEPKYKGLYIFAYSYDTTSRKWYLNPDKTPVLKHCLSGEPVTEKAKQEIGRRAKDAQKQLCKSYSKEECYNNLDKCYPLLGIQNVFSSCEYCGDDFKCGAILSEELCKMKPCSKTCKWQSTPPIGGVCLDA